MWRMLLLLLAASQGAVAQARPAVIADTSASLHAVAQPIGWDEVRWTEGFWAERVGVCRDRSAPAMGELMFSSRYKPFYEHFLIAAGEREGDYHGATWNDGDFYKWIEAASSVVAAAPDAALEELLNEAVRAVCVAQRDDGYVHTPVQIRARNGDKSAKPFSDRHDFEVYNLGHLMTAGCVHYRATGRRELLAAGEKAAGFLEMAFENPTPAMARQAVCPSHYMGLVELYRTTGEARYLRLAEKVIGLRSLAAGVDGGGGDDNQDRLPFTEQREAVGHAVRANYLFAGAADLYLETGDADLLEPLEAVWRNVSEKKLYVTGACGALFDGASPDGAAEQSEITRVHQAYGRNYQLPQATAHNETCAALGAVMWNWRRFLATGEARHIDWIELAMHNAVLAGVSLDGTDYFYTNPLRVTDPAPVELRWSRVRQPFLVSYCCPPNVLRTLAQLGGYAYAKSDEALWVNLYGASGLDTEHAAGRIRLEQITRFPWDGLVTIRWEEAPPAKLTLKLRRPPWSRGVTVTVNGESVEAQKSEGYLNVMRTWKAGDVVRLDLGMQAELVESHPLVEETRNQVAVRRGPVVYCLESADLPKGVRLEEIVLASDARLVTKHEPGLLGGVTVIEVDAQATKSPTWNSLYRPLEPTAARPVRVRLVPYFAWGNRGEGEMSVWMPRR